MRERRTPLAESLRREVLAPAQVARIWHALQHGRAQQQLEGARRRAWARGVALGLAIAGTLVIAGGAAWSLRSGAAATLARADGSALLALEARAARPLHVPLSDGSALELLPGARLEPLELSAEAATFRLRRGRARFAVQPGGPRRWTIDAGAARIEVVGTRFEVERSAAGARVSVHEGRVVVRAATLERGQARLGAGDTLFVPARPEAPAPSARTAARGAAPLPVPELAALHAPSPEAAAVPVEPRPAAATGTRSPSPAAREPEPPLPDVEALLLAADQARMDRDPARAIAVLARIVRQAPGDPRAALAAFTLGRIRDEELGDPRGAALAYAQALGLGLRGALVEDTRARLARAHTAAGDPVAAASAAHAYLARHRHGRHAEAMRVLTRGAPLPGRAR